MILSWQITGGSPSVTLESPDGSFGVREVNTGTVIAASGTSMALASSGAYQYQFSSTPGKTYEYYVCVRDGVNKYSIYNRVKAQSQWDDYTTLGGIRKLYVELTGAYDMLSDPENGDYSDIKGLLTLYVNEAQKWLDAQALHAKSESWIYKTVPANTSLVTFQQARYVKQVFSVVSGCMTPIPWATAHVGLSPEQESETATTLPEAYGVVMFGDHWPTGGIYIAPATESRTIAIKAVWNTRTLVENEDRSFWTVQHPRLLVQTVQMLLEIPNRNTQGVNDLKVPIIEEVRNILNDVIAEESAAPHFCWVMRS